ncbi:MAG TPA: M48 family metallopeptidase, partial [Dokdonella sp.]
MNFFAHQAQARRQTRRMLVMFALAVIVIVAAIDAVLLAVFDRGGEGIGPGGLALASAAVLLVIALGSLYRIATLRGGGAAVARQLGGTQVGGGTRSFAHRRLYNVVEEISIAAGVPMPEVFVLEQEAGINAFASGYAPSDAAITVTRGALEKLTREELQGVIGHEFSHVLNGDMRLNIRLIGVVFGIVVIATIGRKIAELAAHGRGKDAAAPALIGLALFLVGYIGVVLARMIKASVSRQREYLADASAVQFTRQTEGIAGALKKMAGLAEGSRLASGEKEEVAHMLFGDGIGYSALFATHPRIELRIKRLDPAFDPEQLERIAAAWTQPVRVNGDAREEAGVSIAGFAPAVPIEGRREAPAPALPAADARLELSPAAVVEQVGNPGSDDRRAARALRDTIPASLREAAWQGGQALPLVLALVLDAQPAVRERQ